ncbi:MULTISPECIES: glycosyltransferase [unclassified Roseitalea]|uniref:glycosyltransferase n=1 Tax=unclassified Roseitalea TaxID=2639107 RepID=UPI00273D2395|nr:MULTISPECIES: glycosyltransferase [unclassified Roseitalea]
MRWREVRGARVAHRTAFCAQSLARARQHPLSGHRRLTETTDRPLVTFALFAYNQEQYIREAVEGAFAQTYEPLEIILSDDCSTDQTFEIMKELAAAYKGPHEVQVRRNEYNQGTLAHILTAAHLARGEFMLVASGDDISLSERTKTMAQAMLMAPPDVVVASADDIVFDDFGNTFDSERDVLRRRKSRANDRIWFLGATACFRTVDLCRLPFPSYRVLFEDLALMSIFRHLGKVSLRVESPLILRRAHSENVGPIRLVEQQDKWAHEARALQMIASVSETYRYAADAISYFGGNADKQCKRSEFMREYACWPDLSFPARVLLLAKSVRHGYARSVLIRLPGKNFLLFVKYLKSFLNDLLSLAKAVWRLAHRAVV